MAQFLGMHPNSLPLVERWERKRVGAIIKALREANNLSGDEFAHKVGSGRSFLANVEAGRKQLPPHLVPAVAKVFGVPEIVFAKSRAALEDAA